MELFEYIQTLNAAHGPSGDEGEVRETITRLAAPYADEVTTDTLGNLIVQKKGSGPRVMLCAHMDSIGFIVTHIEKEGFLRLGRVGGIAASEALYTPVRFKNGVRGVFAKEEKAELKGLKLDSWLCGHRCGRSGGRQEAGSGRGYSGIRHACHSQWG